MAFSNQFLDNISVEAGKPTKASELNNVSENTDAIKERILEGHYFNNNGVDGEDGYHRADYTDPLWFLSKSTGNTTHKYTALWLDNSDASDVKIRISVQGSTAAISSMTSGQEIGGGAIISNIGANRVITSDGGVGTLNAESNLLFDGSSLTVFTDALVADSNKRVVVGSSSTNAGNKFEVRFDSNQISKLTNPSSGYAELQIETNNTSQRFIQLGIEGTSAGNRMTGTRANAGYIGTYSNDNFTFHTNNQRRAEITASGDFVVENYLGINSASPTNPIYIEGSGGTDASIKILETGSGSSRSLRLQQNSGASIIASEGSSNSLILQTSSEVFRLTQNLELLFGITSARTGIRIDPTTSTPNVTPNIQIESTSTYKPSITLINNENSSISNRFYLGKTRSGSVGGNTAVSTGDELGNIIFIGADGSKLSNAGIISAVVPTTGISRTPVVGFSNVPMNLVISLTRDQYLVPTKRIEIDHDGRTDFFDYSGSTVKVRIDGLQGGILIDKTTRSTSLGNTYDVDANNYINADLGYVVNDTNYVWHQGNDGSGSGLDADLLDGQQGSYYQAVSSAVSVSNPGASNIALATNSTTITGQSNLTWSGSLLSVVGGAEIGGAATKVKFYSDSNYSGIYNGSSLGSDESYYFGNDDHFWYSAGAISMKLDSGLLGIGTTTPSRGLHLKGDSSKSAIRLETTGGQWEVAPFYSTFTDGNFAINRVTGTGNVLIPSGDVLLSGGYLKVSGNPSASSISTNGNGHIGGLTGNGLFMYGKGSSYDVALANANTQVALSIPTSSNYITVHNRLGIGVTPSYPFDVDYAGGGNYVAHFRNTTTTSPYTVFIDSPSGATSGYPLLAVAQGATTYFRIDSGTGYASIGTGSCLSPLTIVNPVGTTPYSAATGVLLDIKRGVSNGSSSNNVNIRLANNSNGFNISYGGTSDYLRFIDGSGVNSVITLVNGGNVGIGEDAPANRLHAKVSDIGSVSFDSRYKWIFEHSGEHYITLAHNASSYTGFRFLDSNGSTGGSIDFYGQNTTPGGSLRGGTLNYQTVSGHSFRTNSAGHALEILANGNIGINTVSPDATLHVSGNIKAGSFLDSNDFFHIQASSNGADIWSGIHNSGYGIMAMGWDTSLDQGVIGVDSSQDIAFYSDIAAGGNLTTDRLSGKTPKVVFKGNGNVGIGTVSPSYPLVVSNGGAQGVEWNVASGINSGINTVNYNRATSAYVTSTHFCYDFRVYAGSVPAQRFTVEQNGNILVNNANGYIEFGTGGNVLTNNNAVAIYGGGFIWSCRQGNVAYFSRAASTGSLVVFKYDNFTDVGSVSVTSSSTAYNTSSDYRLKENISPLEGAINRIMLLKPCSFNFIRDNTTRVDGFLAHEVSDVVPEAITGEKDEIDEDGNPVYQGIDQSKLVPLLVASIKELVQKVNDLEQRLGV